MRERDPVLIERAADLRRRMTDAEVRLWSKLKGRRLAGAKFSRHMAVLGYICDFVCRERLIVEVDGSRHFESGYDRSRDARLSAAGHSVLWFWNAEVLESDFGLERVLKRIAGALGAAESKAQRGDAHTFPLPVGEGRPAR